MWIACSRSWKPCSLTKRARRSGARVEAWYNVARWCARCVLLQRGVLMRYERALSALRVGASCAHVVCGYHVRNVHVTCGGVLRCAACCAAQRFVPVRDVLRAPLAVRAYAFSHTLTRHTRTGSLPIGLSFMLVNVTNVALFPLLAHHSPH